MFRTNAPYFQQDILASGEGNMSRFAVRDSTSITLTNQSLRLGFFTATKTEICSNIFTYTGGSGAGATPTLCKMGVYIITGNDLLATLIASCPNDTSLFASPTTLYAKSLSASFTKIAGQRYAIGALVVTGASPPTLLGSIGSNSNALFGIAPRICAVNGGVNDLPTSFTLTSGMNTSLVPFLAVTP